MKDEQSAIVHCRYFVFMVAQRHITLYEVNISSFISMWQRWSGENRNIHRSASTCRGSQSVGWSGRAICGHTALCKSPEITESSHGSKICESLFSPHCGWNWWLILYCIRKYFSGQGFIAFFFLKWSVFSIIVLHVFGDFCRVFIWSKSCQYHTKNISLNFSNRVTSIDIIVRSLTCLRNIPSTIRLVPKLLMFPWVFIYVFFIVDENESTIRLSQSVFIRNWGKIFPPLKTFYLSIWDVCKCFIENYTVIVPEAVQLSLWGGTRGHRIQRHSFTMFDVQWCCWQLVWGEYKWSVYACIVGRFTNQDDMNTTHHSFIWQLNPGNSRSTIESQYQKVEALTPNIPDDWYCCDTSDSSEMEKNRDSHVLPCEYFMTRCSHTNNYNSCCNISPTFAVSSCRVFIQHPQTNCVEYINAVTCNVSIFVICLIWNWKLNRIFSLYNHKLQRSEDLIELVAVE